MARGYLSGLIWGSVVSLAGAAVVSMSTPLPQAPNVVSTQPAVSEPEVATAPPPPPEASTTSTEGVTAQPKSPAVPEGDTLSALDKADTAPAAVPTVGAAAPLAGTTEPEIKPPSVAISTETAPAVVVDGTSPSEPAPSGDLTISTEPAQPTPPPAVAETSGFQDNETAETSPEPAAAPEATAEAEEGEAAAEADIATEEEATPEPAPEPRVANLPRVEADAPEETNEEATEETVTSDETSTTAPSPGIGQRVAPITERSTAGTSLPTVGVDTESASTEAPASSSVVAPIDAFAAPFTNPDGKPLMGIVLIDDENSIGGEALETFPYPLTFAINPFDPKASEKMARYRAAGFEVLALMDLPLAATPEDAESTFEIAFATMDEAIGVLEGVESGVQGSRALSDQVTAILRDKGYGFITQNSGLNTVQKLAEREGVPSAYVFRDFDGANQTPTVMRRFLDQAAFRAGQEGGVIMLGRVRPDTVSALLLWGLQDRASRVALAPASAVLTSSADVE